MLKRSCWGLLLVFVLLVVAAEPGATQGPSPNPCDRLLPAFEGESHENDRTPNVWYPFPGPVVTEYRMFRLGIFWTFLRVFHLKYPDAPGFTGPRQLFLQNAGLFKVNSPRGAGWVVCYWKKSTNFNRYSMYFRWQTRAAPPVTSVAAQPVALYDASGRVVFVMESGLQDLSVTLGALPKGVYFYVVHDVGAEGRTQLKLKKLVIR